MQIYATNVCHFTVPREFHITEVVLHENFNFTRQVNDIAVLKTSKFLVAPNISTSINNWTDVFWKGEQVDLLSFPPVCLPSLNQSFSGLDGIVAGENLLLWSTFVLVSQTSENHLLTLPCHGIIVSLLGWGLTETNFTSDTLKEIEVGSFLLFCFSFGTYFSRVPRKKEKAWPSSP